MRISQGKVNEILMETLDWEHETKVKDFILTNTRVMTYRPENMGITGRQSK